MFESVLLVPRCSIHISWMSKRVAILFSHIVIQSISSVQLFAIPWTVARQASLSLGFSRQEHWSGLPFPSPVHESEIEVAQKCPTLSDPMDCSLPGSSVHGICQARVLEWVAIAFLHIYTVEYYYVIRNELPSHEKTWRNLKCISLSESRQSTKAACYLIPMMWYSQNGKTMEKIKRSEAARCSRKGWVRVRKRGSLNK